MLCYAIVCISVNKQCLNVRLYRHTAILRSVRATAWKLSTSVIYICGTVLCPIYWLNMVKCNMTYVLCCSAFTASFTCGFLPQWIAKSVDGSVVLWTAECGGRPSAPRHTTIPQSSSLVLDQMPCTTCTMARLKL